MTDGLLLEIFSSIQGEGMLVGCRQIFVRLAGCNLACAYCDTPFQPTPFCRVETRPGSGEFKEIPNPVGMHALEALVATWASACPHHSLSLTGGEPLLQDEALHSWLPVLSQQLPIHLETNGTLPDALAPLLTHIAWISMDVKLASMSGVPVPWEAHREFLQLAACTDCQVKVVVGEESTAEEVAAVASLLQQVAPKVPMILQPVTRVGSNVSSQHLLDLHASASRIHPAVRVIPQVHRFLNIP